MALALALVYQSNPKNQSLRNYDQVPSHWTSHRPGMPWPVRPGSSLAISFQRYQGTTPGVGLLTPSHKHSICCWHVPCLEWNWESCSLTATTTATATNGPHRSLPSPSHSGQVQVRVQSSRACLCLSLLKEVLRSKPPMSLTDFDGRTARPVNSQSTVNRSS